MADHSRDMANEKDSQNGANSDLARKVAERVWQMLQRDLRIEQERQGQRPRR